MGKILTIKDSLRITTEVLKKYVDTSIEDNKFDVVKFINELVNFESDDIDMFFDGSTEFSKQLNNNTVNIVNQQISGLESNIATLESRISELETETSALKIKIQELEEQINN